MLAREMERAAVALLSHSLAAYESHPERRIDGVPDRVASRRLLLAAATLEGKQPDQPLELSLGNKLLGGWM